LNDQKQNEEAQRLDRLTKGSSYYASLLTVEHINKITNRALAARQSHEANQEEWFNLYNLAVEFGKNLQPSPNYYEAYFEENF